MVSSFLDDIVAVELSTHAKAPQAQAEAKTVSVSETSVVSFRLPIDRLRPVLTKPNGSKLFDVYMPFIESALAEFKLTDQRMAAAVIATAARSTNSFTSLTQTPSGSPYNGRLGLGNTQPGDGIRFRGRGFILLTGRANYSLYSQRLGLGTLLTDSPDDANKPEIASRILCDFFKEKERAFAEALAGPDLPKVLRLVNDGGLNGLVTFTELYQRTLAALDGTRSTK